MESEIKDTDILIVKKLSGELTEAEEQQFKSLMSTNAGFVSDYEELSRIWNGSNSLCLAHRLSARKTDQWKRLKAATVDTSNTNRFRIYRHVKVAMRVAAMLLPLVAIAYFVLFAKTTNKDAWQTFATAEQVDSVVLPDKSVVVLNKNSKIDYLMTVNKRSIKISGIAFFKVTHDNHRPFIVDAGSAKVRVLGTSFVVENIESRNRVDVQVETGTVSFESSEGGRMQLSAGERAIYNDGVVTRSDKNEIHGEWRNGVINLDASTLPVAIDHLLSFYPEIISVNDFSQMDTICVTTQFRSQSVNSVIDELSMHFGKKILFNDGALIISDN